MLIVMDRVVFTLTQPYTQKNLKPYPLVSMLIGTIRTCPGLLVQYVQRARQLKGVPLRLARFQIRMKSSSAGPARRTPSIPAIDGVRSTSEKEVRTKNRPRVRQKRLVDGEHRRGIEPPDDR